MAAQPKINDRQPEPKPSTAPEAKPVAGKLDVRAFHSRVAKRYPKILAKLAE